MSRFPTFDDRGYPTEATLRAVRRWPAETFADADALLTFVQAAWWHPNYFRREPRRRRQFGTLRRRWLVSTCGWSGNEDLIGALMANRLFWMLAWVSSARGGHYVFEVPEP